MSAAPPAPPSPGAPPEKFHATTRYVFRDYHDGRMDWTEVICKAASEGWAQRIVDGLNATVPNG